MSPLLYIIYVKNIAIGIPKSVTVSQYVDDICCYCKFSSFRICKNTTEKAAEILRKILYNLGLDIARDKTILIHFNNKNIPPGETHLKIGEHTIKSSDTVKFLGITFDYKLSFTPHINTLKQKCAKKMNIIKFLCGVKWGSDPSTLFILYKSYVRSLIDYGSFIYFPKSQQHVETLEKIQFPNLRALMGYRISTPTNVIIAESKIQSILERTAAVCQSYLIKILSNSNLAIYDTVCETNTFLIRNQSNLTRRILNLFIREIYQLDIHTQSNYNKYCCHYKTSVTSIDINTELGSKMKEAPVPNRLLHNY